MMEISGHNVADVAQKHLCCSCGACPFVCPVNAITLKETPGGYLFPIVNHDLCTRCGACLNCCSGITLSSDLPEDPFTGHVLGSWVGRAADDEIYRRSQSGGVVTALLMTLLDEGEIAGAATVTMEAGTPPRPGVRIARTREDLLSAQGSKYCPVPLLSFLDILKSESGTFAAVALACHVHGLQNIFEASPAYRERVSPVIGLVCDRVMSSQAIDYMLQRSKVKADGPVSLEYRSKEWRGYPGDVRITDSSKHVINLRRRERTGIKDYFTPPRCRLCFDKMNVLSDITVGDPWGIPGADRAQGESVIVARTPLGNECVRKTVEKGQILLREVSYEHFLSGQGIDEKRTQFASYCSGWITMQRPLPDQAVRALKSAEIRERVDHCIKDLRRSLLLDRFPSPAAMARNVRMWVFRRKITAKISKLLRPLNFFTGNRSGGVNGSRKENSP